MSATNTHAPREPATPLSPAPPYTVHNETAEGRQVTLQEWAKMLTLVYRTHDGEDLSPFHSPFKFFSRERHAALAALHRLIPNTAGAHQVTQDRREFIVQRFIRLHWTELGAWNKSWDARHPKPAWQWKWNHNFTPFVLFTSPWFIFIMSAAEETYRGGPREPFLTPQAPAFPRARERWRSRGCWTWGNGEPGWAFESEPEKQPPVNLQALLDLEVHRVAREARRVARANQTVTTRRNNRRIVG